MREYEQVCVEVPTKKLSTLHSHAHERHPSRHHLPEYRSIGKRAGILTFHSVDAVDKVGEKNARTFADIMEGLPVNEPRLVASNPFDEDVAKL